jgi:uncharacterized protein YceK
MKYLILIALMTLSGCASVISGSTKEVVIDSTPSKAQYTVTNKHGKVVSQGTTPSLVTLKTGSTYFIGENYLVSYELPGYREGISTVHSSLNIWYFGNLLLGGFIGGLLVDPLTGAMWTLDDSSSSSLYKK